MKTLIKFFLTYGVYFLFALLEVGSLLLVVNNNKFQQSVFFTSCNDVSAKIYEVNQSIWDYFGLKQVNQELAIENAALKNKLILLDNQYNSLKVDSQRKKSIVLDPEKEYICYSAKVINNSINKLQNYITLNRGWNDGIKEEMSVINSQGVVGIVKTVSEHFSVVMPILNPKAQISCKIKGKVITANDSLGVIKDIGSLKWSGEDYRYANMIQVPRHVPVKKGDTIVTSGYSDFFPEGILVGTVEGFSKSSDDNYYNIKVKLSVNFKTVSYVDVLEYKHRKEQEQLQLQAAK
jgi:rod shape-determining protein MreC